MKRTLLMALVLAACGGTAEPAELATDGVTIEVFDDFGAQHFAEAELQAILAGTSTFSYDTFPATSGPHAGNWAPCGIYTEEVEEVFSVHSMEHGAVTIHHSPGLGAGELAAIHDVARSLGSHVVVSPRSNLAEPVVLTAWTVLARMATVDADAIRSFWEEYSQRGPERLPCPLEVDQAG